MESKQPEGEPEHNEPEEAKKSKGDRGREERQRRQVVEVLRRVQVALIVEGAINEVADDFHPLSVYAKQEDPNFKLTDCADALLKAAQAVLDHEAATRGASDRRELPADQQIRPWADEVLELKEAFERWYTNDKTGFPRWLLGAVRLPPFVEIGPRLAREVAAERVELVRRLWHHLEQVSFASRDLLTSLDSTASPLLKAYPPRSRANAAARVAEAVLTELGRSAEEIGRILGDLDGADAPQRTQEGRDVFREKKTSTVERRVKRIRNKVTGHPDQD
jgi:hypothetical protein